jgi:hypothetical protein
MIGYKSSRVGFWHQKSHLTFTIVLWSVISDHMAHNLRRAESLVLRRGSALLAELEYSAAV